jgi:hypothetical protein
MSLEAATGASKHDLYEVELSRLFSSSLSFENFRLILNSLNAYIFDVFKIIAICIMNCPALQGRIEAKFGQALAHK